MTPSNSSTPELGLSLNFINGSAADKNVARISGVPRPGQCAPRMFVLMTRASFP
jgi:hypothetical protein